MRFSPRISTGRISARRMGSSLERCFPAAIADTKCAPSKIKDRTSARAMGSSKMGTEVILSRYGIAGLFQLQGMRGRLARELAFPGVGNLEARRGAQAVAHPHVSCRYLSNPTSTSDNYRRYRANRNGPARTELLHEPTNLWGAKASCS